MYYLFNLKMAADYAYVFLHQSALGRETESRSTDKKISVEQVLRRELRQTIRINQNTTNDGYVCVNKTRFACRWPHQQLQDSIL